MFKIYNSLTKKIEEFKPINPSVVGMYTCGPTVYDYAHIGNFRTYTSSDFLLRALEFNGYKVKHVMNLTDVGHLTGDNLGDADTGEDKIEKAAKKSGKSAWDIADFYTKAFLEDFNILNLKKPFIFSKATDHIKEQIDLVKKLEEKGFTYKISDGIYFDTSKFKEYGKLSSLDQIKEGARVEVNKEKKNPRDFALWKFSPPGSKRQMEWESPFGIGFPGWHIECSAMSMKYLGETFDIHAGGMDLMSIHHQNEIAQSEAATEKPFVNYWFHGAFMLVEGGRMSKSLGNNYKLSDLINKGFDPLSLRYLYMQTHYRQEMNFTFEALQGAQNALNRLKEEVLKLGKPENEETADEYEKDFQDSINDDLNLPKALSVIWELIGSKKSQTNKINFLLKADNVLGLGLKKVQSSRLAAKRAKFKVQSYEVPEEVMKLVYEREELRRSKSFDLADQLRHKIEKMGYELLDEENGKTSISKK